MAVDIALVGFGKISVDQHLPAIMANPAFNLAGIVSHAAPPGDLRHYGNISTLLADRKVDAVAINTPPQPRFELAREALSRGVDVLLEKPPTLTPSQLHHLEDLARENGAVLYTAWHSQHAAGVQPARAWLHDKDIRSVEMRWLEDVRHWHPGQAWIWEPGGFGVFDPAINGFSILSRILPARLLLTQARLEFPANCQSPIRADLSGALAPSAPFSASFDFLHKGRPEWTIEVATEDGLLCLTRGGADLTVAGERQVLEPHAEYPSVYRDFAELVLGRRSMVDAMPLQLVAETFLLAERVETETFEE